MELLFLDVSTLQTNLASSNVIVQTDSLLAGNGDISVNDNVTWNSGTNLTLDADRDVVLNDNISINAINSGSVTMDAERTVSLKSGSSITTDNGDITLLANINGTGDSHGVYINGATVTSDNGNIFIEGRGTNTIATRYGVRLVNYSLIEATGLGNIDIIGRDGTSDAINIHSSSKIQSVDGDINIEAYGGIASRGLELQSYAEIVSSGEGNISIFGAGGTKNADWQTGVGLGLGGATKIKTHNGNIEINAIGGTNTTGRGAMGLWAYGSEISSSGDGNITINGTAGYSSMWDRGVHFRRGVWGSEQAAIIRTNTGDITINGYGSDLPGDHSDFGVEFASYQGSLGNHIIESTNGGHIFMNSVIDKMSLSSTEINATGGLTLLTDELLAATSSATITGSGTLLLDTATSSNAIGLGYSGTNIVDFQSSALQRIQLGFDEIVFGDGNANETFYIGTGVDFSNSNTNVTFRGTDVTLPDFTNIGTITMAENSTLKFEATDGSVKVDQDIDFRA